MRPELHGILAKRDPCITPFKQSPMRRITRMLAFPAACDVGGGAEQDGGEDRQGDLRGAVRSDPAGRSEAGPKSRATFRTGPLVHR